jgi:ribosome recycling factor
MIEEYLSGMKADFEKVHVAFKRELTTIRTGRASPQMLENVQVEVKAYGSSLGLTSVATITAPDPRMLMVNPWDKGTLRDIEDAIRNSGLGLNPSSDGQIIRVPIPPLTADRRNTMTKQVAKMAEDARVRARGVRRDLNDLIKEALDAKDITEDENKKALERIQKATDAAIAEIDAVAVAKEKDIKEG